jgi:S-adenosylmethionine:diacylglycerol 3-amino-3-carboxypropyl transferase
MEGTHLNPAHLAERPLEVDDFRRMRSHEHVDARVAMVGHEVAELVDGELLMHMMHDDRVRSRRADPGPGPRWV